MPRKKSKKRVKRRKMARRSPAANLSAGGVVSSLAAARSHLVRERDALDGKILRIDALLADFGAPSAAAAPAPSAGRRTKRGAFRPNSLKDYVHRVLSASGAAMAVRDINDAVLRAGFRTKNKTLSKSIGIAVTQMPGVKKLGRGVFQLG
jgi:hypothetical protein